MPTTTFSVSTESALNAAITSIDVSGANAAVNTTYTITLGSNITLSPTLDLEAINLGSGDTLDLIGSGDTIDGGGTQRGLFVFAGHVAVSNLTIAHATATGGVGGNGRFTGSGGGAGLGGGLFVAGLNVVNGSTITTGGTVTLSNVNFTTDTAVGGAGGIETGSANTTGIGYSGGGGLGGAGGQGIYTGGGGIGKGATGGTANFGGHGPGGGGIVGGAAAGGAGYYGGTGGSNGGGGGSEGYSPTTGNSGGGGGGGIGGGAGTGYSTFAGGNGGFGGGGGPGPSNPGNGGFGGGAAGGVQTSNGGGGGFGGGGGGAYNRGTAGLGGFGGGNGHYGNAVIDHSGGGGGLGAGGAVFVQQGGLVVFQSGSIGGGSVTGGVGSQGATSGSAFGSGIFLQGNQTLDLQPGSGQTLTIANVITDQTGSGGTGGNAGAGAIAVSGGGTAILSAANSFTGGVSVTGATLDLAANVAAGAGAIHLVGHAATLAVAHGVTVGNSASLTNGDVIDLAGITNAAATVSGHVLSVSGTGGSFTLTLSNANPTTADFTAVNDGNGGTNVTMIACFAAGTSIATPDGDIAVEQLRAGDLVRSHFGGAVPVQWIGHRHIDCARHPDPAAVNPVRIRAGAFGPATPARDLLLSPDHAVYVNDVLIPARCLIDGVSVVQEARREVTYFHVELPQHDVLLAEGLPAESYLDTGNRSAFANGGVVVAAHPDFAQRVWEAQACAPQITHGPKLGAVRHRLAVRAVMREAAIADQLATTKHSVTAA